MVGEAHDASSQVVDRLVALVAADVETADSATVDRLTAEALRVRCWLDGFDARLAARTRALHPTINSHVGRPGSAPASAAATVLTAAGRRGLRDANAAAARAEVIGAMPTVGAALSDAEITAGHVDAMVGAWTSLDDQGRGHFASHADELLGAASTLTPEQFNRECRDVARNLTAAVTAAERREKIRAARRVKRWTDRDTGEHLTLIALDPLADEFLWSALRRHLAATRDDTDTRTHDQRTADAVVELVTAAAPPLAHALGGAAPDACQPAAASTVDHPGDRRRAERVVELSVLVDLATLQRGLHDHSLCETADGIALSVDEVRRLACDAEIIPIVLGGHGQALDVGRANRLATRQQRQALRAMYATCAHPGCTVGFERCRIHHVNVEWEHLGRTDLDNLIPVCERHHHLVHEGGWVMRMTGAERAITLIDRSGVVTYHGPSINRCSPATAGGIDAGESPPIPRLFDAASTEPGDRPAPGSGVDPPVAISRRQILAEFDAAARRQHLTETDDAGRAPPAA